MPLIERLLNNLLGLPKTVILDEGPRRHVPFRRGETRLTMFSGGWGYTAVGSPLSLAASGSSRILPVSSGAGRLEMRAASNASVEHAAASAIAAAGSSRSTVRYGGRDPGDDDLLLLFGIPT